MSETDDFLAWLVHDCGYVNARALPPGPDGVERYVALSVRSYNTQVVTGRLGDRVGPSDAW